MKTENNSSTIDYNWPISKRCDTMYLSKINNITKKRQIKERNLNLDISDINTKNKIKKKEKQFKNLKNLKNKNEKNKKNIFRFINYPYNRLKNDDIIGSKTKSKNLITKRCLNPLEPKYKLQKKKKKKNKKQKFKKNKKKKKK